MMKRIVLFLNFVCLLLGVLAAKQSTLPKKIIITDKFFSPWGTQLYYKYELELTNNEYIVQRKAFEENGKKKTRKKEIGSVNKDIVVNIIEIILEKSRDQIRPSDFQKVFSMDSIETFLERYAENHWITNEQQLQFIKQQLIKPTYLKKNLETYFRRYDHSGYIDGSSTEVDLQFFFEDSILSINSKSILWCGLPIEVNGIKNFSPELAKLIGQLIPASKTERNEQFSGSRLFFAVTRETIGNHRKKIDSLGALTYQSQIDSLEGTFLVSNARIINAMLSTNWDGEKRLSCRLREKSIAANVSIQYSTTIENGKIMYPVSLILRDYQKLLTILKNSAFFWDYITENKERNLSIVYDDNGCFTEKTREYAIDDCPEIQGLVDFDNTIFISLRNEFGNVSRWGLLPNGQYFVWWQDGRSPTPNRNENYIECE